MVARREFKVQASISPMSGTKVKVHRAMCMVQGSREDVRGSKFKVCSARFAPRGSEDNA